ncbi:MAG: amino acid transporter [Gemmatimonadetes bacterium]|nr:MAG: amino acid transporter [Gemmatimonadota bacterium]PYO64472.1 MAG: amino acid transporter [Gemmatimonadota bacterium]PYO83416.1 MAG: amino acid transporter [Gemmatimonadota bacterium]PYP64880.1 MAG: amino acid transporter [Gemmatimonadota bacterium]
MPRELARVLGLRDLILIVVGTVIGSGIFLVPSDVLAHAQQDVGWALLVWAGGGVLSLLGALTYGELGAMEPDAGGIYVYMRKAFGPLVAFLYGWAMFFVIASGSIATLAVAFGTRYLPQLVKIGPLESKLAALLVIAAVTWVNIRGTRRGATVQNVATAIKVGALLLLSVGLLAVGRGLGGSDVKLFAAPMTTTLLSSAGIGLIGVLWAYEGWQYVTFSAGETVDPQRTFPRGIVVGTALLIGIYLLANVGYIAALGPGGVVASKRVAADAAGSLFGVGLGTIVTLPILVSIFGAANGLVLTTPRLFYAMARDGLFFRRLAEVHPRFGTPAVAVGVSAAWAAVLAASGTFEQLYRFVVFTSWIFFALGAAAVFVYRRRFPDAPRPFRTPGYPVTPALFILAAAAIVANTLAAQPRQALVGLGIVATGVPAFAVWKRFSGRVAA